MNSDKPSFENVRGQCTLVGAGPGDPELLTIKALKAIQAATVLLVDATSLSQVPLIEAGISYGQGTDAAAAEEMKKVTGGIALPPGLKLPF